MAEHHNDDGSGQRHPGPENTPRLRLKRKAPLAGYVDGAWWPHSDDLPAELHDLVAVPTQTGADDAHTVMMAAAAPENVSKVGSLLASGQVH